MKKRNLANHFLLASLRYCLFVLLILSLGKTRLIAQEQYSWNDLVDWNGVNHWYHYLILSPGFQGPNSLPVPESTKGLLNSKSSFEHQVHYYFNEGDETFNLYFRYYHAFMDGKIAIDFSMVPLEYYSLSDEIRDRRKLRSAIPQGFVPGDLFAGTHIQLLKNRSFFPDISFSMVIRTASGRGSEDGRFTDAPGYYFTLNAGKSFQGIGPAWRHRWYLQTGFYAWQTNLSNYYQNDALVLGLGFASTYRKSIISLSLDSYWGYIGAKEIVIVSQSSKPFIYEGDQPIVFRLSWEYELAESVLSIRIQEGLRDFPYRGISLGSQWFFN